MTTFYICRHGQTENNKYKRFSGWIDTPLTEAGVQDALSSGKKLKGISIDKIVASDLGRAFTTAYIISREIGFSAEIKREKELREVNYGDFANQPYTVYPEVTPEENTNYTSPNGESLAQMQRRVLAYIERLSRDFPDQAILLVAHDGTINAVRSAFTGETMGIADLTHNAHDFVAKFGYEDGKIISYEEVGHS
jgi:broad specificity phosphatase PhoE